MHGKGVYTWPNGKKYVGDYKNDKKEGNGTYYWPDGREYSGPWKDGKQDGVGRFKSKNGTIRTGLWEKGKRVKWIAIVNSDGTTKPIDDDGQGGDDDADVQPSTITTKSKTGSKKTGGKSKR